MIQFATVKMLPALERIWAACFGDGPEYTGFLFAHLLRPEHILVDVLADGEPAAMLCIEPMTLATPAGSAEGVYIYGVATLPAYQGGGRSTALLEHCHTALAADGFALSALVPANENLFRFYGARGYETAFAVVKIKLAAEEIPAAAQPCKLFPAKLAEMAGVRDTVYSDRARFVRWGGEYLTYIGAECELLGGEVLRTLCGGESGYAVCYRDGETVIIKELAVRDEFIGDVLAALHAHYGVRRYTVYLPADTPGAANKVLPFAMVRWYDKEKQSLLDPVSGRAGWIAHVLD